MGEKDITISAVIPAYNIEGYIERAVNSILAQTRRPEEILVVDDGSRDRTAEKIKAYGDHVRYIHQDNKGLSGARNTGIRNARCDWIAFLDGDDEWLPQHLELQSALLGRNPDLAWTGANFIRCLCDENRQGPDCPEQTIRKLMQGQDWFDNFFTAHAGGTIGHPNAMVIHRKVFDTVGLFDEKQAFAEDIEMWWRITYAYPKFGFLTQPTSIYHLQRPGTLTESFRQTKLDWLIDLLERNIPLASQHGMEKEFSRVVRFLVTSWIRGLLFENRPEQIDRLLQTFEMYLPVGFRSLVRLLMISPRTTAQGCHGISKVVRTLKLRKTVVRPPSALKAEES